MRRIILSVALALGLAGCAVGNTFDYRSAAPPVALKTDKSVLVKAVDQRPYVLKGDNTPQWVGMFRGGFGNPFGVHTLSGDPLADDVAVAVASGLTAQGVTATVATDKVAAGKVLTVTLRDWRSDTMYNTMIRYDLEAQVTDPKGAVLARNKVAGEKTFDSFGNMPSTTGTVVLGHFRTIMAELLSAPQIASALR